MPGKRYLVFSDLDGTLLEHFSYSFVPALPGLALLKEKGIPLILCSSKTRSEMMEVRQRLGVEHPFVTENGGGVFIPRGYPLPEQAGESMREGYRVIVLGLGRDDILKAFRELGRKYTIRGFSEMDSSEVVERTGLPPTQAAMAMDRDFSEPFLFLDEQKKLVHLEHDACDRGLAVTRGGRFYHLMGSGSDKGRAVKTLIGLYTRQMGSVTTVAIGDSRNDLPMLLSVDLPFLVQRPDGRHDGEVSFPALRRVDGVGPEGWNSVVLALPETA